MVTGAFVAQRPLNDDEVRGRLHGTDLASRRHADKEPTARCEELFSDKDGERGADGAAHDAVLLPVITEDMQVGVVARPAGMRFGMSCGAQVPHNVAIRIQNAKLGNRGSGQTLLAARFA